MSAPILLIANLAGGSAKTTTASAIATASAEYGKNVLAIDADPAATLTFLCGIENPRMTTHEVSRGDFSFQNAVVKTAERYSLIPGASRAMDGDLDWNWISSAAEDFDLIVVDTPSGPTRTLLDIAPLVNAVVIPTENSFLSLRGALHVKEFLHSVQNDGSARANIETSLLPVKCDGLSAEFVALMKDRFSIIEPAIRVDQSVPDAEISMRSVLTSAPQSGAASDYREVTYAILEKVGIF